MWTDGSRPAATFAPAVPACVAQVLGGLLLAALATAADPAGRLLGGLAATLLLLLGARGLAWRPVLTVGPAGLTLRTGPRHRQVPWSDLGAVRVRRERRTPVLELDLGDGLVVLSRGRLGRHPEVVADVIADARGSGG